MDKQGLQDFYNELAALSNAGKEQEATGLVGKRFDELPEDVQGELLTRMYFNGVGRQVEEAGLAAEIQEKTLAALDALEVIREKLEMGEP